MNHLFSENKFSFLFHFFFLLLFLIRFKYKSNEMWTRRQEKSIPFDWISIYRMHIYQQEHSVCSQFIWTRKSLHFFVFVFCFMFLVGSAYTNSNKLTEWIVYSHTDSGTDSLSRNQNKRLKKYRKYTFNPDMIIIFYSFFFF